jgi:regulator of replication initiation timing
VRAQLQKETLERQRAEEESERIQREAAASKAIPEESAENADEAGQRAAEAPESDHDLRRELARGRQGELLNKLLRKKLSEIRHTEQEGQIARQTLEQQVRSLAAELGQAREELSREAASRQKIQDENQRLRQRLADTAEAIAMLKAGREVVEEQVRKRTEELTRAGEALRQNFEDSKAAAERAGKPEEGWAKRLFSSWKNKTDDRL